MKKYPIQFNLYNLNQDQRMRDVITRELLPWLAQQGINIQPVFISEPSIFTTEAFVAMELPNTGYAGSYRVPYKLLKKGVNTVSIFQKDDYMESGKQVVSHCSLQDAMIECFWTDGTFENTLGNRIFLLIHELIHLWIYETGSDISLHKELHYINVIDLVPMAQFLKRLPLDKLPMIEVPDEPVKPTWKYEWPVNPVYVTQSFGERVDIYPKTNGHSGMDFRVFPNNNATKVFCSRDGVVSKIGTNRPWLPRRWRGYGNNVVIDHGDGEYTRYAHLATINVHPGQTVKQGEILGNPGDTGWVTGFHLHAELFKILPSNKIQFINPADTTNSDGAFFRPI